MPTDQYGNDIITLIMGAGESARTCFVRKELLCSASAYFRAAPGTAFKEAADKTLAMQDECPIAFAVTYGFLHTGEVRDAVFYTRNQINDQVLWLRTLKLADKIFLHPLIVVAYNRLRDLFAWNKRLIPEPVLIKELYSDDTPMEKLQRYVVGHCFHHIKQHSDEDWKEWEVALEAKEIFSMDPALHFAKVSANSFEGCEGHPSSNCALNAEELFPEPMIYGDSLMVGRRQTSTATQTS
jgi:hypothetical protein